MSTKAKQEIANQKHFPRLRRSLHTMSFAGLSHSEDLTVGNPSATAMYRVPSIGRQMSITQSLAPSSLQVRVRSLDRKH